MKDKRLLFGLVVIMFFFRARILMFLEDSSRRMTLVLCNG